MGPSYRFGPFAADTASGRLYHGTREVPLTPKSFRVLSVLLRMQGQLVSREELFHQVWPDTFVEANNLARNISMIRKALHDCDPDHEYIVTVTGRGYRFVAPVTRVGVETSTEISPPAGPAGTAGAPAFAESLLGRLARFWSQRWRASAVLGSVILSGGVALGTMRSQPRPEESQPERRLSKITSAARFESEPSWSPDGRWIAYSSDRSGNFDIWVRPVSDGRPIQISFDPGRDWQPSWSPDGRHIVFRSERDGGGLFVVPAFGGAEHRLTDFGFQPQWAPDASRILFAHAHSLFLVGLDGAAPIAVCGSELAPLAGRFRVGWHPDGRRVSVYGNDRTYGWSFWTMPLDGGSRVR
jgi:DNA-binding winged helix-turn-helix (wHTH) protein